MERQKFEDKWKDAFRDAEVTPSDNVWTNIELDLEKSERDSVSHKLFFYKMVAAASVVFALMVGAGGLYFYSNYQDQIAFNNNTTPVNPRSSETDTDQIKTNSADVESNDTNKGTAELNSDGKIFKSEEGDINHDVAANRNAIDARSDRSVSRKRTSPKRYSITSESNDLNAVASSTISDESTMVDHSGVKQEGSHLSENGNIGDNNSLLATQTITERGMLPALTSVPESALNVEQIKIDSEKAKQTSEVDPVALMLAKMDQREKELKKEEDQKNKQSSSDEKLWTSVGFAAGSFNAKGSGLSPVSTPSTTFSGNIANGATNEANASGIAYSIGVNMGKRFADKWVVQGGVNYLTQLSDYTAQTAIGNMDFQSFRPESINELNKLNEGDVASGDTKVITTAPYNVNNSVRYISLPLQAGYMLVDKKFGVQLNAGISTDLFLQNTKKAEGQNISAINQSLTDDDNPYRTTNFSGLFGTELTYKLGSRYRVALNPGVRYPFSSIYKSSVGVQSAPLTFDVGMRFRYIFQ